MKRFLNDCDDKDNDRELVKKEEVVEEIALVNIIDQKVNHENVEVIIENNNDLQNGNQFEEQRFEPTEKERVELKTPSRSIFRNKMNE